MIMRNDVLLDIATFLARRWSGNPKIVIILTQDKIPIQNPTKIRSYFHFLITIQTIFKNIGSGGLHYGMNQCEYVIQQKF